MCDWKDYFEKNWDKAFQSKWDKVEFYRVLQIYESHAKIITPREIIAFINEILLLKLIHDSIPEQYMALFVINKDEILENPLLAITNTGYLKGLEYLYKGNEDFEKYITALAYQILPENAVEVIYRKQIKNCLVNNQVIKLEQIANTNIFNKIIVSVISELNDFEKPILALSKIKMNLSEIDKQCLWDDIYNKISFYKIETGLVVEGEKILLIKISDIYKETWLTTLLENLFNKTTKFNSINYAKEIDGLSKLIVDNSYDIDIFKLLPKRIIELNEFISLVKNKQTDYKKYNLNVANDKLDMFYSGLQIEQLNNIEYITYLLDDDFKFESFEKSLNEKLTQNKMDIVKLPILLNCLKFVSSSSPKIKTFLNDIELNSLFSNTKSEDNLYYDIIAMRIVRGNEFKIEQPKPVQPYRGASTPKIINHFENILNTEDQNIIKRVSEIIEYYISYGELLIHSLSFSNNLIKSIVSHVTENHYQSSTANVLLLIKSFDKICDTNKLNP